MSLVGTTLTNGVMVEGGTDHLKNCLKDSHTMPETCQANLTELLDEITGPVFSSLANWLEANADGVCSYSGSGLVQMSTALVMIVTLFNILS